MARDRKRIGCAAERSRRGEPLMATASRVRRWLLVEQPGPWGREALVESRLDTTVAQTLRSRARRDAVRVVLIRRPGWEGANGRRVYLVRSDRTRRWIARRDVDDPEELLSIDLSVLDGDEPPRDADVVSDTVRLVCTNGKHDPCCADLGRPVVRALRDAGVGEVWESSHVGGDRFAANLVFLPTGVYYGRVPPDGAARLIEDHDQGILHLDHYRGRSCYQPLTQAAEIFLRRELDERRLDALTLRSVTKEDQNTSSASFRRDGETFALRVSRERGPAECLTCSDHGLSHPWQYRLLGMQRVPY